MKYLILAQICLTVGTPNWVIVVCYVCFALQMFNAVMSGLKEGLKTFRKK